MGLSHKFSRPLLIYDDKCDSCTKFTKAAGFLSRGRIRTVGHYYSKEGLFKGRDSKSYGNDNDNNNSNPNNLDLACEYKDRMTSCGSTENTLRRIINMMRNSGRFRFQN